MGLDQYMYAVYKNQLGEEEDKIELGTRRKHPNLEGWMENLWREKTGSTGVFNCVELELTEKDLVRLQKDILSGDLAKLETTGFFFGGPSDDYYRKYDLQFIIEALIQISEGRKVYYTSWW